MRTGVRLASAAAIWLGGFAVLRVSALAPEDCPTRSTDVLDGSARAGGTWIERGQDADGRYVYEYDRASDEVLPGYNIVRHAGVTMSLYQLARAGHDDVLPVADAATQEMIDDLVPAGDGVAYTEEGTDPRLGASALMAAALGQRRAATGDDHYDDVLRGLGRFLAGQINERGQGLEVFDLETGAPVPDRTSRYATGEAAWALAQLHNFFPDEGWDEPARRVLDYLATERDEVEGLDYAPWPDQWAAYTLSELAPSGLDEQHIAYARALAGRFGMLIRSESQKDGWPVPIDPRARGAGLGVWAEGLGSLAHVASVDDRMADLGPDLEARLQCAASLLEERQETAADAADWPSPMLVEGAWFRDDVTRMDDQQHALSGLLAAAGSLGPVGG